LQRSEIVIFTAAASKRNNHVAQSVIESNFCVAVDAIIVIEWKYFPTHFLRARVRSNQYSFKGGSNMTLSISSPTLVSLGTKLVQAVQKEAAMQSPLPLSASACEDLPRNGTATAAVTLVDNDRLSHLAAEITVIIQNPKTRALSAQTLAERFTQRATYLTERLQFVEGTADGGAIVRSTPTSMRGKRAEYYEAYITDSLLSFKRYKPHVDKPGRELVPFCITDEILARLTDDAVASFSTPVKTR
jgi:hypothetical protein